MAVSFTDLPHDVHIKILCDRVLNDADVTHCGVTCRRLHALATHDTVWHRRYVRRFHSSTVALLMACAHSPMGVHACSACGMLLPPLPHTWLRLYHEHTAIARVSTRVCAMLAVHYINRPTIGVSYSVVERMLVDVCRQLGVDVITPINGDDNEPVTRSWLHRRRMLIVSLRHILDDGGNNTNLTMKYYAIHVLYQCTRRLIQAQFGTFVSVRNVGHQAVPVVGNTTDSPTKLMRMLLMFAQYFLPQDHISQTSLDGHIDRIVALTKEQLSKLPSTRHLFEHDNRQWTPAEADSIMRALADVLHTAGYRGDSDGDTDYSVERLCINRVMATRRGRPITLCALMHLCAYRLRVHTELLNAPCRVALAYNGEQGSTLLDVWDACATYTPDQYVSMLNELIDTQLKHEITGADLQPASTEHILQRLLRNAESACRGDTGDTLLMAKVRELAVEVDINQRSQCINAARYYFHHAQCNVDHAVDLLRALPPSSGCPHLQTGLGLRKEMQRYIDTVGIEAEAEDAACQKRSTAPQVHYRVGQIMHHQRYNYRCVVYGWHMRCEASMQWQLQMGVHQLLRGAQQPFYRVLVDDGSVRYAAQENLVPEPVANTLTPIKHVQVPRYFEHKRDNDYVMNSALRAMYPEDDVQEAL